jgi:hypothetical protein
MGIAPNPFLGLTADCDIVAGAVFDMRGASEVLAMNRSIYPNGEPSLEC